MPADYVLGVTILVLCVGFRIFVACHSWLFPTNNDWFDL